MKRTKTPASIVKRAVRAIGPENIEGVAYDIIAVFEDSASDTHALQKIMRYFYDGYLEVSDDAVL